MTSSFLAGVVYNPIRDAHMVGIQVHMTGFPKYFLNIYAFQILNMLGAEYVRLSCVKNVLLSSKMTSLRSAGKEALVISL